MIVNLFRRRAFFAIWLSIPGIKTERYLEKEMIMEMKNITKVRGVNPLEDFEQKFLQQQGVVPLGTHSPFLTIYSETLWKI